MKIFLPLETLKTVKDKYIFVDTCLLLDFINFNKAGQEEFMLMLDELKRSGEFLTIEPVAIEFCIGSTEEELAIKKGHLNKIIPATIKTNALDRQNLEDLIIQYGIGARGTSYVDLCLGAAAKQYTHSLVLTRNYKDFPLRIFNCLSTLSIALDKEIRTYGFYEYSREQTTKRKPKDEIPF